LDEEGEEGMIHSLLSSLPDIADDILDEEGGVSEKLHPFDEEATNDLDHPFLKEELVETASDTLVDRDLDPILDHVKADSEQHERPASGRDQELDSDKVSSQQDCNENEVQSPKISEILPEHSKTGSATDEHILNKVEEPETTAVDGTSIIPSLTGVKLEDDDEILPACSVCPGLTKLFLTDLLKHADTLYSTFPPSHPGLSLSSIMGPQSVVFTWSDSPSSLPSDNTAEAMVSHPELVVYPFIETDSAQMKSKESSESEEKRSKKARGKRHKLRKSPFSHMEKKTMVAGTVIVLGVAMAIYGVKASRPGDRGGHSIFHSLAEGHGQKDWRRLGGWVSGAVAGVTTKIMNGLSSTSS
jgi:TBC1 domain family member 20